MIHGMHQGFSAKGLKKDCNGTKRKHDLSKGYTTKHPKTAPNPYILLYPSGIGSTCCSSVPFSSNFYKTQASSCSVAKLNNNGNPGINYNTLCSQNNNFLLVRNASLLQRGSNSPVMNANGRHYGEMVPKISYFNAQVNPTVHVNSGNDKKTIQTNVFLDTQIAMSSKFEKLKSKGFPYYHPAMGWVNLIPTSYDTMAELGIPVSVMSNNVSEMSDGTKEVSNVRSSNGRDNKTFQFCSSSSTSNSVSMNERVNCYSNTSPQWVTTGNNVQYRLNNFGYTDNLFASGVENFNFNSNTTTESNAVTPTETRNAEQIKTENILAPKKIGDIAVHITRTRNTEAMPINTGKAGAALQTVGNTVEPVQSAIFLTPISKGNTLAQTETVKSSVVSTVKDMLTLVNTSSTVAQTNTVWHTEAPIHITGNIEKPIKTTDTVVSVTSTNTVGWINTVALRKATNTVAPRKTTHTTVPMKTVGNAIPVLNNTGFTLESTKTGTDLVPMKTGSDLASIAIANNPASIETAEDMQALLITGNTVAPRNTGENSLAPIKRVGNIVTPVKKEMLQSATGYHCDTKQYPSSTPRATYVHLHPSTYSTSVANSSPMTSRGELKTRRENEMESDILPTELTSENVKITVHTYNDETIVSVDLDV